jgi:argininosuccinate lyase
LKELQSISNLIGVDIIEALSLESTMKTKSQPGGTAPERVAEALRNARQSLLKT